MENIKILKLIIFARSVINMFVRTASSFFILQAISSGVVVVFLLKIC